MYLPGTSSVYPACTVQSQLGSQFSNVRWLATFKNMFHYECRNLCSPQNTGLKIDVRGEVS